MCLPGALSDGYGCASLVLHLMFVDEHAFTQQNASAHSHAQYSVDLKEQTHARPGERSVGVLLDALRGEPSLPRH